MKYKLKKWHIALMSFLTLFATIFASLFSLRADTIDEETGEVLTDNWELSTVFYDSTVNNGKTPLTEINWDASDGSYKDGTPRVITVQINYKNTSAITTYQPGELEITIPNLIYTTKNTYNRDYLKNWETSAKVGANNSLNTGYDWIYLDGVTTIDNTVETLKFNNAYTIEENANFEGSIQIIYTIKPLEENPEKYQDECSHIFSTTLQATLTSKVEEYNLNVISNTIAFDYNRTYYHPWVKDTYTLYKTASKISSFDGMPNNATNYIWVKYNLSVNAEKGRFLCGMSNSYPYIDISDVFISDYLPEGCIVIDKNGNEISLINNLLFVSESNLTLDDYGNRSYAKLYCAVYVGYPINSYNEINNNLNITNTAEVYGTYASEIETSFLDDATVSLNLANFKFEYNGNLYGLSKTGSTYQQINSYSHSSPKMMYQSIIDNDGRNIAQWKISPTTYFTGTPLTVRIGDDLLCSTDSSGKYNITSDNDYYYTEISIPCIYNRNNEMIPAGKYNMTLYVRYANSNEFVQYGESFTNNSSTYYLYNKKIIFNNNEKVCAWYLQIDSMNEGISKFPIYATMRFVDPNIKESGTLCNFAYLKVFSQNENGTLNLLNSVTENSYGNFITKELIASYDISYHKDYIQRACSSIDWDYYTMLTFDPNQSISKTNRSSIVQDNENEVFKGSFNLTAKLYSTEYDGNVSEKVFLEQVPDKCYQTNIVLYDLLPIGMTLTSTAEDIINSAYLQDSSYMKRYKNVYNFQRELAFNTNEEMLAFFKDHTVISIIENWENTGRTRLKIEVDFSDFPLLFLGQYSLYQTGGTSVRDTPIVFPYSFNISYDSFIEYGNVWKNRVYAQSKDENIYNLVNSSLVDNGLYDMDAVDITNDNNTEDKLLTSYATTTITSIISTHQDVTTYVKTDQSNYSTGIVDASCNSEYEYKLRVRTGAANVTNLVIYTSIEEAQPNRTRWHGEFMGVDTAYAENKGYAVKVWYSPNKTVGTLAEDTSWQVYDEATIDKSKVKSLAFQYLVETDDTTGTNIDAIDPAVLPANSLTYVLVKMKSPANENETRLARMDCWTQWNAIDEFDRPVDFITGINSNIVKVALPNSVKEDSSPFISLKFRKEIQGTDSEFENMKLNMADQQTFMIRLTDLTANEDGSYNQVTALLRSDQELIISQIPIGTYLLEELGDNYFDFIDFTDNNDPEIIIEGVTLEKTLIGYVLTVSEDLSETVEFNIKVTNEIENERFYEDKDNKENFFFKNKIEESSI